MDASCRTMKKSHRPSYAISRSCQIEDPTALKKFTARHPFDEIGGFLHPDLLLLTSTMRTNYGFRSADLHDLRFAIGPLAAKIPLDSSFDREVKALGGDSPRRIQYD